MSSDGYFDDDFDDAAFAQLDEIEAAYSQATQQATSSKPAASTSKSRILPTTSRPKPLSSAPKEDSFYDLTLDLDDEDFSKLQAIEESYTGKTRPVGPTRQTTLFGDVLPNGTQGKKPTSRQGLQRTTSTSRNPFGSRPKKTKIWDQTAFAKSGQKKKGKGRMYDDGEEEEENVVFEQFPAPFVPPNEPPLPMKLKPDLLEAKHWVYPLNKPKRDYQFNIVKHSLFENTIISVPTGMGKTFIAGVVMLNYYRWFPEGKVIFVAPTKPLVAQQIEASHQTCGIPGSDAAEMTGEIPKSKREKIWREKRVLYMTPQTLMNDLATQNCDVMSIVLIVVDEAHKATGDYAYNQIVRWMMAKNPHFRLIALTATPGSTPMAVQTLVDGLHISHIEIRDENSIDLRPYLHEKKIEQHCIKIPQEIILIRDTLAELIEMYLKPLQARGIMWPDQNPIKLHPYSARAKMTSLAPDQRGFIGQLSVLGSLAQAMGYLLEGTIDMAYSYLQEVSTKDTSENASKNWQAQCKKLRESELFKKTMAAFEACRTIPTGPFLTHPKKDKATRLLIDYFGRQLQDSDDEDDAEGRLESRAMVFISHREAVEELVEALNVQSPIIRASMFIGQGTDKHGKRGQSQKEQLETIQKFQAGEFNVLVATCIGEEGLDIGEVDMIICYDTQKTPIRMLQRFGRTGRKRAGVVHLLLAEDREEFNLEKARAAYKEVQKSIARGDDLEFYADVERLLPDHAKPAPLERVMEIKPYVREDRSKARRSPTKAANGTKRKRNDDMMRNIPAGASTTFVSVAELIVKGSKKRKVIDTKTLEEEGEDDDLDKELEAGPIGGFGTRRTQSLVSTAPKSNPWDEEILEKPKGKGKMKRAATESIAKSKPKPKPRKKKKDAEEGNEESEEDKETKGKGKAKGKAKSKPKEPSLSLSQQGRDDSVDRELEEGLFGVWRKNQEERTLSATSSRSSVHRSTPKRVKKEQLSPLKEDVVLELSDRKAEWHRSESPITQAGSRLESLKGKAVDDSMAWLVDDDDEPDIVILSSSPVVPKHAEADESIEIVGFGPTNSRSSDTLQASPSNSRMHNPKFDVLELSSEPDTMVPSPRTSPESKDHEVMPPPSYMPKQSRFQPSPNMPIFEDTQPIRRIGQVASKRQLPLDEPSSDTEEPPPPSQRRLRRYDDSPEPEPQPKKRKAEKKSRSLTKRKHNPLLDYSAEHSGDEVSAGSSNSDDDVESESDRHFIKDSPMTQISPSYDQTQAYRKGLMTQAPGSVGPMFAQGPTRSKPFGRMEPRVRRRVIDSSPPPEDDDYEFGSFVVDNDADISYLTQADDLF